MLELLEVCYGNCCLKKANLLNQQLPPLGRRIHPPPNTEPIFTREPLTLVGRLVKAGLRGLRGSTWDEVGAS